MSTGSSKFRPEVEKQDEDLVSRTMRSYWFAVIGSRMRSYLSLRISYKL